MLIVCAVSLITFGKAHDPFGQTGQAPEAAGAVEKEIIDLEHEKVEAMRQGGAVAADWFVRHYAEDIDYISGNGASFTKAQTVDEFRSGDRKLRRLNHEQIRVRVYGNNTAVLTYRGDDIMERNGKITSGVVRTTDVYVRQEDGVWRIAVHHVTPVLAQ